MILSRIWVNLRAFVVVGDFHRAGIMNGKTVKAAFKLEEDREAAWLEAQTRLLRPWLEVNKLLACGRELVFEKWKQLS